MVVVSPKLRRAYIKVHERIYKIWLEQITTVSRIKRDINLEAKEEVKISKIKSLLDNLVNYIEEMPTKEIKEWKEGYKSEHGREYAIHSHYPFKDQLLKARNELQNIIELRLAWDHLMVTDDFLHNIKHPTWYDRWFGNKITKEEIEDALKYIEQKEESKANSYDEITKKIIKIAEEFNETQRFQSRFSAFLGNAKNHVKTYIDATKKTGPESELIIEETTKNILQPIEQLEEMSKDIDSIFLRKVSAFSKHYAKLKKEHKDEIEAAHRVVALSRRINNIYS